MRRLNPPYGNLYKRIVRKRKRGKKTEARKLYQQLQRLPSGEPNDPNYRRLVYCRYADDFLLGFAGPKAEAEEIKRHIGQFLRDHLKQELTLARFWGVGEEKSDTIKAGGFNGHITTKLHERIQATSSTIV
jgi:hypothetical protein